MSIKLIRIDDRLIHGQIANTWIKAYSIEQVLILNDQIVSDKVQQSVIQMTAPLNVKVQLFGIDEFLEIIKNSKITRNTMIIITNSIDAYRLKKGGLNYNKLNVGGMRFDQGRTKISKAVSVTDDEREAFTNLLDMEVEIEIQMVPQDEIIDMKKIIYKEGEK